MFNQRLSSVFLRSATPGRRLGGLLALTLAWGLLEPIFSPPAQACFFWQACAQRRGRASNTRAGGKRTGRIRGGNDASIPYVITPRNAWIRQPNVETAYPIRWNPVEGAQGYTVRLWSWTYERDQKDFALWETTVDGDTTEIDFPRLLLEPGTYYSIEVVTDDGVSSDVDEGFFSSGFQLLYEEGYEILRSQIAAVTPAVATGPVSGEPSEDASLALAGAYFLEEMYADSLRILRRLADRPEVSELVYSALGDTYSAMGLNQLAIVAYDQGLALAQENFNVESEAAIHASLADVYATLGQLESSLTQLQLAKRAYQELRAQTEVARLERRIDVISARITQNVQESPLP